GEVDQRTQVVTLAGAGGSEDERLLPKVRGDGEVRTQDAADHLLIERRAARRPRDDHYVRGGLVETLGQHHRVVHDVDGLGVRQRKVEALQQLPALLLRCTTVHDSGANALI